MQRSRGQGRERGQTLIAMAFFLASLVIVAAVLIDLIQVREAQVAVETAIQSGAVDGARMDLPASTLIPRCPPGEKCTFPPRELAVPDDDATHARVRAALAQNLESVAYLLDGVTPKEIAAKAEIAVVNPQDGACLPSPFAEGSEVPVCYYDAFVAARVAVPLRVLWGSTRFSYRVAVVGALTDDPFKQHPATPIPTSTPAPVPTFPLPGPTCGPNC